MISLLFANALLGAVAGVLAGLLGIGGGIIIVPMLLFLFSFQGVSEDIIMHMALGTSLASIMFTSLSSAYAHHKRHGVDWGIVKYICLGILVGTYLGSHIAAMISTQYLQLFFALFLLYASSQMILGKSPKPSRTIPGFSLLSLVGAVIGIVSSLVGIGGGTLSVPFMVWHNVEMRKAIGTSAAIGIPIAFAGTIGYITTGYNVVGLPDYSLGYIALPSLCALVMFSTLTAPYGTKLTYKLPVAKIKKFFALFLFAMAIKMLFSALD